MAASGAPPTNCISPAAPSATSCACSNAISASTCSQRVGKGVALTAARPPLRPRCAQGAGGHRRRRRRACSKGIGGSFSVSCTPGFASLWLCTHIAAFQEMYPDVVAAHPDAAPARRRLAIPTPTPSSPSASATGRTMPSNCSARSSSRRSAARPAQQARRAVQAAGRAARAICCISATSRTGRAGFRPPKSRIPTRRAGSSSPT